MKIAFFCPREQYLTKMSRVRFHQIDAISELSDLSYTGIGWDNYNSSLSVQANLKRIYGTRLPNLLIIFDHKNLIKIKQTSAYKCMLINEMHSFKVEDNDLDRQCIIDMVEESGIDFGICHHKNEMENPYFYKIRHKFYNIPHCAHQGIFYDRKLPKTIDILLCGSLAFPKYNLRQRFASLIERLSEKVVAKIHQHPGGFKSDANTNCYLEDFAKAINSSKICLTCSSIYKCAFGKYVEIPMCNSVLCGDVPNEREDFFRSFMLEISVNDSDDLIMNKLFDLLEDPYKLNNLSKTGLEKSSIYTMEYYARQFMRIAESVVKNNIVKIFI